VRERGKYGFELTFWGKKKFKANYVEDRMAALSDQVLDKRQPVQTRHAD
jgi:hypothetical protein